MPSQIFDWDSGSGSSAPVPTPITLAGLTPNSVKKRLVGLEAWLRVAETSRTAYNDETIRRVIVARVRQFERETRFRVNPVQVVSSRDGAYAVAGSRLDVTDTYEVVDSAPYDYIRADAIEYMHITLRERPVREVQRIRIQIGSQTISIPSQWYTWNSRTGKSYMIPLSTGIISITGFATLWLGNRAYVPAVVYVDYIAGLQDDWQDTVEWSDLTIHLEEYVALQVLYDIAELYDAGTLNTSISGEGIEQSLNYTRFEKRKLELEQKVQKFHEIIMAQEAPIMLTGV